MSYYSQGQLPWGPKLFGWNTDKAGTYANYACLVTAIANFMTLNGDPTTPEVANNQIKLNNGYVPGTGILYWSAIPRLNPAIIECGESSDMGQVNQWLVDGPNFAIIEVRASRNQHFVLGNLVNTMIDSLDGQQKNILAYPFVHAHLYKWRVPGRGAVPATVPVIVTGEPPMTGPEEIEAYDTLFKRRPDITVPTGRTGLQFIRDGKAELDLQRANAAAQVAAAMARATDAETKLAEVQAKLTETTNVPGPVTPPATITLPTNIMNEFVNPAVRILKSDAEMIDYAGSGQPYFVTAGTIFPQYSTFMVGGRLQVRTQKSKTAGLWYGTDEALFDPLPKTTAALSSTDTIHLGASKMYGTLGKILRALWPWSRK